MNRIAQAKVCVVGLGGLGCASAAYLATSGVGVMTLVDPDLVRLPDLGRQILYTVQDIGKPKGVAAAERLTAMSPNLRVRVVQEPLSRVNAAELLQDATVVVDGTDALEPRLLMNSAYVHFKTPTVFAGVGAWNGYVMSACFSGPCFRCVWDLDLIPRTTCEETGVFGPLTGIIGAAQASEALRIILGFQVSGRLTLVDAQRGEHRTVNVHRRSECPMCGGAQSAALDSE